MGSYKPRSPTEVPCGAPSQKAQSSSDLAALHNVLLFARHKLAPLWNFQRGYFAGLFLVVWTLAFVANGRLRMNEDDAMAKLRTGLALLDFSMWACHQQVQQGLGFVFEHPKRTKALSRANVRRLLEMGGRVAQWDQCMTGLVSKVNKLPMLKPSVLLTNVPAIYDRFHNLRCDGSHAQHQQIQGSEGGERRSTHAERYPDKMVRLLADGLWEHITSGSQVFV